MKEKDAKERDWDREMREVDKLLAKLPEAEPTLGHGVPTVPVSPRPLAGVAASGGFQPGPARGRAWLTTWLRVSLGLRLGIAHTLSIILIVWGLGLAGRQLLPRLYGKTPVPFFCPEP